MPSIDRLTNGSRQVLPPSKWYKLNVDAADPCDNQWGLGAIVRVTNDLLAETNSLNMAATYEEA